MWLMGLVAPRHMGSSRTRARTRDPCTGRRILNHCATKEALCYYFLLLLLLCYFSVVPGPVALASLENLLEMQNSQSTAELQNQNLHFTKILRSFMCTLKLDRLYAVTVCLSEYHYYYSFHWFSMWWRIGWREKEGVLPSGTVDGV